MTNARITAIGLGVFVALSGCSSDYATSATHVAIDGTMTANVVDYGGWAGTQIATATAANGSVTVVGKDVNAVQIRLFLIGVDLNTTQPDLVREILLTPVSADTVGYLTYSEGAGPQYSTQWPGGHGTVTLTHVGKDHITGTFALTAYAVNTNIFPLSYTVINGVFDIKPTIGAP